MIRTRELYDLEHTLAAGYLRGFEYPWEALGGIGELIRDLGPHLGEDYVEAAPAVWVHRRARIAPGAALAGPCIIGAETQVRQGALIRGNVLVGDGCVVGNSTEVKNSILFDGVQVPHFNYVGDSILGYRVHFGAGVIASNLRSDRRAVVIRSGTRKMETGLGKCGAMVGDFAEVGCNSVLNPGTVLGRKSRIYPLSSVCCTVPEEGVFKGGLV